jgi:hypothetical protein
MFLRAKIRRKDGKEHRTWSLVENKRVSGGRVVQRHMLYLGEINSSQELAWRKSIEVFEDGADRPRTLALFPEDQCEGMLPDASIVRLKLSQVQLSRPRQWGACWLAVKLWEELQLDRFWAERLPASRKGTRWDQVLPVLTAYRLIAPGAEWRLHREWYGRTRYTQPEPELRLLLDKLRLGLPAQPPPKITAVAVNSPPACSADLSRSACDKSTT